MLTNKTILLGVTGGIACYKSAYLASALVKQHCNVHVIMTKNATEFISPLTFESLTGNRVVVDTFDKNRQFQVEHISLADQADLVIIAPATANVLAKLANGLSDDMLTTTVLACDCPKIAVPAMNTRMYLNPVTQDNLEKLRHYGWEIVKPAEGRLACGAVGKGKMPEPEDLLECILHRIAYPKDMEGIHLLVTAGPTREALDPVRYLTNHSTGTMGYAIARAASNRGANVTLVTGPTSIKEPAYVNTVHIVSAQDMFEAVKNNSSQMDIIIKSAAVADYRPSKVAVDKIKKGSDDSNLSLSLERTTDILKWLGLNKKDNQFLCGFSMETKDMIENSRKKLIKKNLDMIAANNLKDKGAGFGGSTNQITILTQKDEIALPLMSKDETAHALLDEILKHRK